MLLNFRQGIVQVEPSGFVTVGATTATLTVYDIPIIIAVASGPTDYLHVEHAAVPDAWSIFPGIDQWLYWDIHSYSADRTFGVTILPPITSAQEPANPVTDQHWFDTISATTKVWSGTHWTEKNRVFACKLAGGSVVSSMSISAPDFTGTQVGIVAATTAGEVLYDVLNGKPLRSGSKFVTTENILTTHTVTKSDVKFAATLIPAEAQQAMARLTVVNFNEFGKIVHADANVANDEIPFGIVQHDCIPGDVVSVTMNGVITSPFWDWSIAGINSPLYCTNSGALVSSPQIPHQIPVAYIIDTTSILLNPVSITIQKEQATVGALDDLSDVTISTPTNNQVLTYNGSMWINSPPFVGATNLDGLTDVVIAAPINNHVLKYNGTTWVNGPAATDLNSLTDVTITTPAQGDLLRYTGTEWVNSDLTGYRQLFTVTDGQTAFGPLLQTYVPNSGQLSVYVNGLKQMPTTYVETNSTTFTLTSPAHSTDVIMAEISEITPTYITPITILDQLADVTISDPLQYEILQYNGTQWINGRDYVSHSQAYTSTAGQQVFTLIHPYTPGSGAVEVHINGIRMHPGTFTEVDSTHVRMNDPLLVGEEVLIETVIAFPTIPSTIDKLDDLSDVTITSVTSGDLLMFNGTQWVNNDLTGYRQTFTATTGQTVFGPLSNPYVVGAGQLSVYIDGVKQYPGTYTETSTTSFTLTSPAAAGETIMAEISILQGPFVATPPAQDDIVAVFRVGIPAQEATHVHFVAMTRVQAESLITGTSATVTITSTEQNGHTHGVTFSYNDAQYTWVVDSITNNLDDNHLCIEVNHTFEGLTGVTVTTPTPGQVLTYQAYPLSTTEVYPGQGYWYNADPSGGGGQSDRIVHALSGTTVLVEDTTITAWAPGMYDNVSLMYVGTGGVAVGLRSGFNTGGEQYDNVAIGTDTLTHPSSSASTVAIGVQVLGGTLHKSAYNTVAIGDNVMTDIGHSFTDVCIGRDVMVGLMPPDGNPVSYTYQNIAIGEGSMTSAGDMRRNVAIGLNAMTRVPYGNDSVAIGASSQAGDPNTPPVVIPDMLVAGCWYLTKGNSTFDWTTVGAPNNWNNLEFQATGSSISDAGNDYALLINRAPNVSVGASSLTYNYSGRYNTAIGTRSMLSNRYGNQNTAIGDNALNNNFTGHDNTAVGFYALAGAGSTVDAVNLVASVVYRIIQIGYVDFTTVGAASNNVGIEFTATGPYVGGGWGGVAAPVFSNNTALGSGALSTLMHYSNATGVGASAEVTGSNQVQLGDLATTTYVYGTVQNRSDARDKTNIRDTALGLEFINSLRAVDFQWDYREAYVDVNKDGSKAGTRYHHGVIAQEVKHAMDVLGVDFGGYQDHSVNGGKDVLSIGYDELIAPLIKAVQELSRENQRLTQEILTINQRLGE